MLSVLLVVVATVVGAPVTTIAKPATTGPVHGRLPNDVVPLRQDLSLDLDPARVETRGSTSIAVTLSQPRQQLWLNARQLVVDEAIVVSGGERLQARFAIVDEVEGLARLELPKVIPAGAATIELRFRGALHDNLDSLYRVEVAGRWYLFSQFEALGAREAFPCFDEPANKIPFRITVTHPSDITVVGNTQTVKRSDKNGRTTIVLAETKPLPTYLLAFVGGPIEIVDGPPSPPGSSRMTSLPLRGIVTDAGHRASLALSLKHSADVVADQERAFGLAYPFDKLDIVAVPDFSSGAMENAGLITYRDTRLYVDERSPLNVQKASLEVIAHETAHQWFGNFVTMRWWDDLWLNEAFATWMAARTLQRLRPDFDGDLETIDGAHFAMHTDSLASTRRIREPIVSRGDIDNAFDDLTYSKGAAVIGMVERFVDRTRGEGTFLRGVSNYLRAHAYGTGGSDAFFAAISDVAGVDVAPLFTSLIDQPGVPAVHASCSVVDGTAGLDVTLSRWLPLGSTAKAPSAPYTIPLCVRATKNADVHCGIVSGRGRIALDASTCPDIATLNVDGAGYLRPILSQATLPKTKADVVRLTAGERMALADAIVAALSSGTIDFASALAASDLLIDDDVASTALTSLSLLEHARDVVFFDDGNADHKDLRARANIAISTRYQRLLNTLGLVDRKSDTPRDRERRATLAKHLVDANDQLARTLAAAGRDWLKKPHARIARDLVPAALRAHVRRDVVTSTDVDALVARAVKEPDPQLRTEILRALADTPRADLVDDVIGFAFRDELRVNERGLGLHAQGALRQNVSQAFTILSQRWADFTARIPEDRHAGLVDVAGGFCDAADIARVDAFFADKRDTIEGLTLMLANVDEGIALCAAQTAATRDVMRTTLQRVAKR